MSVQWSLLSSGVENCAVACCMTGLLKFDQCKGGNLMLLDPLWISAIHFVLLAMGTLLAQFLCKWVFQCALFKDGAHESYRCSLIIHSFAFGGRGVYFMKKKKTCSCSQKRQRQPFKSLNWLCKIFLSAVACWLPIFILVFAWPGAFSRPSFEFNAMLGYPGEGHWSKKFPNLSIATWNTRSLTYE